MLWYKAFVIGKNIFLTAYKFRKTYLINALGGKIYGILIVFDSNDTLIERACKCHSITLAAQIYHDKEIDYGFLIRPTQLTSAKFTQTTFSASKLHDLKANYQFRYRSDLNGYPRSDVSVAVLVFRLGRVGKINRIFQK